MITILKQDDIRRATARIASMVLEANKGVEDLVIIGIRTRGMVLARRLQAEIKKIEGETLPLCNLDITLHRDDLSEENCSSAFLGGEIDFNGKNVVLCDDVVYTGRTIRAAIAAINGVGRAKTIRLYALIDRGHRELPFRADGVGKNVPTSSQEKLVVRLEELDGEDAVYLLKKDEELEE